MPGSDTPPLPASTTAPPPRDELVAAPPFLTWRAIYAIVLGTLAIEIAVFAAMTAALR